MKIYIYIYTENEKIVNSLFVVVAQRNFSFELWRFYKARKKSWPFFTEMK